MYAVLKFYSFNMADKDNASIVQNEKITNVLNVLLIHILKMINTISLVNVMNHVKHPQGDMITITLIENLFHR